MAEMRFFDRTFESASDMTAHVGKIVKITADNTIALAGADEGHGVLRKVDPNGTTCTVCLIGVVDVVLGATVTAGTKITSDANGKAVAVDATTDACVGILCEGGDADERRELYVNFCN